jgi:hypothetical protein
MNAEKHAPKHAPKRASDALALALLAFLILAALAPLAAAKVECAECGGPCPSACAAKKVECRPELSKDCTVTTQGFKAACRRQINMGCSLSLAMPPVQCNEAPPGYLKDAVDRACDCGFLGLGAVFGGAVNKFHREFPSPACEAQPKCPAGLIQEKNATPCSIETPGIKLCCEIPEEILAPGTLGAGGGGGLAMSIPEKNLTSISISPSGTKEKPFSGYAVNDEISLLALGDGGSVELKDVTWSVVSGLGDFVETSNNTAKFVGYSAGPIEISATSAGITGETWLDLSMVSITKILVIPSSVTLPAGATKEFSAIARDVNNKTVAINPAWSVENLQGLALINASSGEFKALGPGAVRVRASYANVTGYAAVNITESQLARLEVRGPPRIYHRAQCYENYYAVGYNTKGDIMGADELPAIAWRVTPAMGNAGNAAAEPLAGVQPFARLCTIKEGGITLAAYSSNLSAGISIEIVAMPKDPTTGEDKSPALASVSLDYPADLVTKGARASKEIPFVLRGVDTQGNDYSFTQDVNWAVASLDSQGNGTVSKSSRAYRAFFTGTAKGRVRVEASTAASPSPEVKSASVDFNVVESEIASVKIYPDQDELQEMYGGNIEEGKYINHFSIDAFDQWGNWVQAQAAWRVNVSETVAAIDANGRFTARSAGSVRITAIPLGAPGVNDSVSIKIIQRILDRIDVCLPPFGGGAAFCNNNITRPVGSVTWVMAFAYAPGGGIAAGVNFGWSSENSSIASLESSPVPGVASFLARGVGQTNVLARASDKQGNARINVIPAVECTPGSIFYTPYSPPSLAALQPYALDLFEAFLVVNGTCKVVSYFECKPGNIARLTPDPVVGRDEKVSVVILHGTQFERNVSFGPRLISPSPKQVAYYLYYLPQVDQAWIKIFGLNEAAQVYENPTLSYSTRAYVNATLLDVVNGKAQLKVEYVC